MRSGSAELCVRQGGSFAVKSFPVFCPKAIAGLGVLPDTIMDRSIPILLQRRKSSGVIERFRPRKIKSVADAVASSVLIWSSQIGPRLESAEPELPDELDDRAQDIVEPLIAIAECASTQWTRRAREAAISLCGNRASDDESRPVQLLRDIRSVFDDTGEIRIRSADLALALSKIEESPWEAVRGREFDARRLASALRRFKIRPKTVRFDDGTAKGYFRSDFDDAWERYLPNSGNERNNRNNVTKAPAHPSEGIGDVTEVTDVTVSKEMGSLSERSQIVLEVLATKSMLQAK